MKKTISGGERKRTAIGVELITNPQIVLLDEPTSGLDSLRAFSIIKYLRELARKGGKTIVTTIHQPSSQTYMLFDKVIMMCDGHIVYQGLPAGVPAHFAQANFEFKKFSNPADAAMRILSINYPKQQADIEKIEVVTKLYDDTQRAAVLEETNSVKIVTDKITRVSRPGCCTQFSQICKRNRYAIKRNPMVFKARVGQAVFLGVLTMAVFWDARNLKVDDGAKSNFDGAAAGAQAAGGMGMDPEAMKKEM